MAAMTVAPRNTPSERDSERIDVEADDTGHQLVLRFEENDGIAKLATLTANELDVELHHILTYT